MTFKKLEMLGGIGSIFAGLGCTGLGWMDYMNGQSWKIWVVMTVVLVVNGIAMIRTSAKRPDVATDGHELRQAAKARI